MSTPSRARLRYPSGGCAFDNNGSGEGSGRCYGLVTNQFTDNWLVGNHQLELVGLLRRHRPTQIAAGGCAVGQMEAPEDGGTGPILTEAAARMIKKMETFGVVQPPCVYAEGPSIIAFN